MQEVLLRFIDNLQNTSPLEYIAVVAGIISVWFSKKENILVFPVGLVNTIAYVFISVDGALFGEASVNFYYTIMSIYGWILWSRRNVKNEKVLRITFSTGKEWVHQLLFFLFFYISIYFALTYLKTVFYANTIPGLDAFASAAAFTGMWLMARKKVESWYWWIITNITAIPLYFIKDYVLTSVYYFILLILAVAGLMAWKQKAKRHGSS
ncbi:MAG: nicotinamide mononucleotide transporter [Flavisolibacter sp.]|jgi:nicotinamide mononucleotide transporter|nr:nicotinamide mononucleotide transporter [Flavisolibacter sp.]